MKYMIKDACYKRRYNTLAWIWENKEIMNVSIIFKHFTWNLRYFLKSLKAWNFHVSLYKRPDEIQIRRSSREKEIEGKKGEEKEREDNKRKWKGFFRIYRKMPLIHRRSKSPFRNDNPETSSPRMTIGKQWIRLYFTKRCNFKVHPMLEME